MDVFVVDRLLNQVQRVSLAEDGSQDTSASSAASLSGDGRFVAFRSRGSKLVPGDTNGADDIFLFDRQLQRMLRMSMSDSGVQGDASSREPSLSADGRFIGFESGASNLISGDGGLFADVFLAANPNAVGAASRSVTKVSHCELVVLFSRTTTRMAADPLKLQRFQRTEAACLPV
jgi:Tol biopolymer transport system component